MDNAKAYRYRFAGVNMRRLVLQKAHREQLRKDLFPTSGHEAMAYVLCGRAGLDKYLSHLVIPLSSEYIVSSSSRHVTADTVRFRQLLQRAKLQQLTIAVVHSHREGPAIFSSQDDVDEPKLVEIAQNRNGKDTEMITMILDEFDNITARWWKSPNQNSMLPILEIGDRFVPLSGMKVNNIDEETYSRQMLALGSEFQKTLGAFRIGIMGAGATGSATANLLARMGANNLMIVDDDVVELSNLNRLHGATPKHAQEGTPKVDALAESIRRFRPDINLSLHKSRAEDPSITDRLSNCDILFGCTDDQNGRLFINRMSYFYCIPVIDMGIGIDYQKGCPPKLLDVAGRVTVIGPNHPCLLCRDIIDPNKAREEELQRKSPNEYQRLVEEAYIRGAGIPNPAVVTITTEVASMAVDELIERIIGYRSVGPIAHRVRKFHLGEDKRPGVSRSHEDCPICQSTNYWGRGDMTPHLDRIAA